MVNVASYTEVNVITIARNYKDLWMIGCFGLITCTQIYNQRLEKKNKKSDHYFKTFHAICVVCHHNLGVFMTNYKITTAAPIYSIVCDQNEINQKINQNVLTVLFQFFLLSKINRQEQ